MKRKTIILSGMILILSLSMVLSVSAKEDKTDKYYVGEVVGLDAINNTITITEHNSNSPMKFALNEGRVSDDVFIGDEVVITANKNKEIVNIRILPENEQNQGQVLSRSLTGRRGPVSRHSLGGFDPFEEMNRMQRVMNRMFNDSVGRGARMDGDMFSGMGMSFDPAIDVKEQEDSYLVIVDLPGVDKDTININAQPNSVTISGERSIETEEQDDTSGIYRSERSFGSFQRTIPLMERIVPSEVTAETTEGVLAIKLPKENKTKSETGTTVKVQ